MSESKIYTNLEWMIELGKDTKRLKAEDEKRLSTIILNEPPESDEYQEAIDTLVRANVKLIPFAAKKVGWSKRNQDKVITGLYWLYKAATKYDSAFGRFSTYATKALKEGLGKDRWEERTPFRIPAYLSKYDPENEGERKMSEDIKRQFRTIMRKTVRVHNANEKTGKKPQIPIGGKDEMDPLYRRNLAERDSALSEALNQLDERERIIIRLRFYGEKEINGGEPLKLKEIGHQVGITKERIRQIQNEALQKIRQYMNEKGYY